MGRHERRHVPLVVSRVQLATSRKHVVPRVVSCWIDHVLLAARERLHSHTSGQVRYILQGREVAKWRKLGRSRSGGETISPGRHKLA